MKPIVTPRQLGDAIGVSESSIKRWADEGRLRASRTAGGHRRIAIADAIRFVRSTQSTLVRPERLGMTDLGAIDPGAKPAGMEIADDYYGFLSEGAEAEARGLPLALYLSGWSVAEILDGPLCQAMARLGDLWRHDEAGIWIEHRAVDLCLQGLSLVRSVLPVPPPAAVEATGGAPSGDPYLVPTMGIALALQEQGYRAINLGPDCPYSTWLEACNQSRSGLFWLSCSAHRAAGPELAANVRRLLEEAPPQTVVAVGGNAVPTAELEPSPRLFLGSSVGELVAFVKGLRPGGLS